MIRKLYNRAPELVIALGVVTGLVLGGITARACHPDIVLGAQSQPECGTERWAVKVGSDPAVKRINMRSADFATIEKLRSFKPPDDLRHFEGRAAGVEDHIFIVNATLTLFKREADSDYHLVLTDDAKRTMIAEIPSPDCVPASSPFARAIAGSRSDFEKQFPHVKSSKGLHVKVRVIGPAYFDYIHGQTGVAPNGIEIHPVLGIDFR